MAAAMQAREVRLGFGWDGAAQETGLPGTHVHAWDAQDFRADVCMGLVAAQVIDTVSKACAYGAYDKLQEFVAADPGCVNAPDESGYFPLQWAALNNRMAEANYLLAQGASVNATDHTGQTALHWAAVRGSLPVIETLLRNHADCELKDNKGYTVAHVAAQYGQTAVLYHLVRWDTWQQRAWRAWAACDWCMVLMFLLHMALT